MSSLAAAGAVVIWLPVSKPGEQLIALLFKWYLSNMPSHSSCGHSLLCHMQVYLPLKLQEGDWI